MAQTLTQERAQAAGSDRASEFSNSAVRAPMIRNADMEIERHKHQIELLKKSIKEENQSIKAIYDRMLADLGMTKKRFETAVELVRLPQEKRDAEIDQITEVYEALMKDMKLHLTGRPDDAPLGPEPEQAPAVAIVARVEG